MSKDRPAALATAGALIFFALAAASAGTASAGFYPAASQASAVACVVLMVLCMVIVRLREGRR